ncbi:MAG: aminodeoxychorismate/anthranilate synthase component II [Deltaproteobacteria bacterium]|jgi:anthranilate synthase component 2|nr:aminodeoxychorismate/anthranilate synthase component II [Deltaproteobacteria bacterium]
MRILLFDCRDSFTYNLAHAVDAMLRPGDELEVRRHDLVDPEEGPGYGRVILSPGPGVPAETENLMGIIARCAGATPVLGVCLGHQALAQWFGARLVNLKRVFHGISSRVGLDRDAARIFLGLPEVIDAGRYHSWLVDEEGLPAALRVTARDEGGRVMGVSHRTKDVHGVQFHPESVLTPLGPEILRNFIYGEVPDA